jgi:ADP-L-glycero-D-manno-heptose 6-epimerase
MPEAIRERYQYFTRPDIRGLLEVGYSRPVTPLREAVYDYVVHYLVPDRVLGQDATGREQ